jgi:cobyrinic acid a,c-diamide synthase
VQAAEIADLETRLDAAAARIAATGLRELPPPVVFAEACAESPPPLLRGVRIGVARDTAFSFLYPANLDTLRALGAELIFFSPLTETALPAVDSLYLPGGYPELHLAELAANAPLREEFHRHHQAGKPIYAECGGLLCALESLADKEGHRAAMLGLLPGHAALQDKLAGLGMQAAALPEGELRGHTFHHSRLETPLQPLLHGRRQRDGAPGEAVYRLGRLTASYLHLYFASNPAATAQLFRP